MFTSGRKWHSNKTNGDYSVHCSYCGCRWPRSRCVRDNMGRMVCPDDRDRRTELDQSRGNADAAMNRKYSTRSASDSGPYVKATGTETTVHFTSREDLDL